MNSVAQIAIGTLVLGAAFIFGSQLRNQSANSDVQPELTGDEQSEFVWQKPRYEPVTNNTESDHGLIDMPEARKRVPSIPSPATLDLAKQTKPKPGKQPVNEQQPPTNSSLSPELPVNKKTIVEPDFSQLASSFFETSKNATAFQQHLSESVAPLPRQRPSKTLSKSQSTDTSITPPRHKIADEFDIAPRSTSFQANDFAPRFNASTPIAKTADAIDETRQTAPIQGPDNTESAAQRNPLQEPQVARKIPVSSGEQLDPIEEPSNEIQILGPSNMTDEAKSRMVEVRSRHTNGLRLETNRFIRHRCKQGETLQQVSRRYYGKPDYYLDIYLANQDVLRNPGRVAVGTSLRIPVFD